MPREILVDTRGHRCPTPTLRLRRALEKAAVGEIVLVWADDPLARIDIPHFCIANGHDLIDLTTQGGVVKAKVLKVG